MTQPPPGQTERAVVTRYRRFYKIDDVMFRFRNRDDDKTLFIVLVVCNKRTGQTPEWVMIDASLGTVGGPLILFLVDVSLSQRIDR